MTLEAWVVAVAIGNNDKYGQILKRIVCYLCGAKLHSHIIHAPNKMYKQTTMPNIPEQAITGKKTAKKIHKLLSSNIKNAPKNAQEDIDTMIRKLKKKLRVYISKTDCSDTLKLNKLDLGLLYSFNDPALNRFLTTTFNTPGNHYETKTMSKYYPRDIFKLINNEQAITCIDLQKEAKEIIAQINRSTESSISLETVPNSYFEGGNIIVVHHSKSGLPIILHGHNPQGLYADYNPQEHKFYYPYLPKDTERAIEDHTSIKVIPIKLKNSQNESTPPSVVSDESCVYYHLDCYACALPDGRIIFKNLSMLTDETIFLLEQTFGKEMIVDLKYKEREILNLMVLPEEQRKFIIISQDLPKEILDNLPNDIKSCWVTPASEQKEYIKHLTQIESMAGGMHCRTQNSIEIEEMYPAIPPETLVVTHGLKTEIYNDKIAVIKKYLKTNNRYMIEITDLHQQKKNILIKRNNTRYPTIPDKLKKRLLQSCDELNQTYQNNSSTEALAALFRQKLSIIKTLPQIDRTGALKHNPHTN